jgi:hypothetical protein
MSRCLRDVAAARATSRGIGCASEYCKKRTYRAHWVCSIPPRRHRFRPARAVFRSSPSPSALASGSSSRALRLPFRVWSHHRPGTDVRAPSLGFLPSSRYPQRSPRSRASRARFVPSSTFRTSSTACSSDCLAGLFHPATTSRVRSSGGSPRRKPHGLVARRCPLAVARRVLPPVSRERRPRRARLQGLAPPANPFQSRDGLGRVVLAPLVSFSSACQLPDDLRRRLASEAHSRPSDPLRPPNNHFSTRCSASRSRPPGFECLPSEGSRTMSRCLCDVAAARATSHGMGCASECCERRSIELIGLLDPATASSFPNRPRGVPCVSVAVHLRVRFILSCASPSLQSFEPPPARH